MSKFNLKNIIQTVFSNRMGIIRASILALGLFVMSVIWPMGKLETTFESVASWDGTRFIGPGTEDSVIRQEFSPNFKELKSMSVYVVNEPDSFDDIDTFLRIYTKAGKVVAESRVNLADFTVPGWVDFPLDADIDPGDLFFYTVGGTDGEVFVALCSDAAGNAEDGAFYFNGMHSGGTNVVAKFEYIRPWGIKRIVIFDLMIAGITAVIYAIVSILLSKMSAESIIKTEKVYKHVLAGIVGLAGAAACVWIIAFEPFEHVLADNIVLCVGAISAAALLIYCIITAPSMSEERSFDENMERLGRAISTIFLAIAIVLTCTYQNSMSDYEHGLWERRAFTLLGLYLFSLGKKKQIWNVPALVWSVISVGIGYYHVSLHSDHIEHITTAISTAWLIWVAGLVAIGLFYRIKDKDYKKLGIIDLKFAIPVVAFWVLCCIFSVGRVWPAMMTVVFVLVFLFYYMVEKREHLLEDVCNALILSFLGTALFCIYRRPYQYYMMSRYSGIFLTVAVAAMFYLLAVAAALTKILIAYKRNDRKSLILSYAVLGIAVAYILFTSSRTALLALAFQLLFALIVFIWEKKKGVIKGNVFVMLGTALATLVVAFVSTFGVTRMIPAVVRNPFYFFVEDHDMCMAFIYKDTPLDGGERLGERFATIMVPINNLLNRVSGSSTSVSQPEALAILGIDDISVTHAMAEDSETKIIWDNGGYSNGRMDIFRTYISNLNLTGHEAEGCPTDNGKIIIHAHNSFIQVAYSFGIIVGIAFVLMFVFIWLRAVYVTATRFKYEDFAPMMLIIIVAFGAASLTEWIYHPMNPVGFMFIFSQVLLAEKGKEKENV